MFESCRVHHGYQRLAAGLRLCRFSLSTMTRLSTFPMCHYITATIAHKHEIESVALIFELYGFGFELISNPHVAQQIGPQGCYILTSGKYCDCGTALGSLNNRVQDKAVDSERQVVKFRKQGWSEAKIKRWLEQKEQTKERHLREVKALAKGGSPELDRWITLLKELINVRQIPMVGLLLHWYHAGVESEQIKIQRRERLGLSEVTAERLMKIEEDVLYEIVS
jgi:hypothetical protein